MLRIAIKMDLRLFVCLIFFLAFNSIHLQIVLTDVERMKLIHPLELIYKDKSWQQNNNLHENVSFNNQAKNLLEYSKHIRTGTKTVKQKINKGTNTMKTFKFSRKQSSFATTDPTILKSLLEMTSRKQKKTSTENTIPQDLLTPNGNTYGFNTNEANGNLKRTSITRSPIDLVEECKKIKFATPHSVVNNEIANGHDASSFSCVNCMEIKSLLDCKTFEDNELSELVNVFCCQCSPSTE